MSETLQLQMKKFGNIYIYIFLSVGGSILTPETVSPCCVREWYETLRQFEWQKKSSWKEKGGGGSALELHEKREMTLFSFYTNYQFHVMI